MAIENDMLRAIEAHSTVVDRLNEACGSSFLGTVKTIITYVTNTKRRDMFVECSPAEGIQSFIFVTAIRRRL
jgi:hypothetical protein